MHASKLLLAACLTVTSAAPAQTYTYEAITIKPTQSGASVAPNGMVRSTTRIMNSEDGLSASNLDLRSLIANAYSVKPDDVTGVPASLTSGYDINAKMDDATAAALSQLPPDQRTEQRRLMLQALLATRFHLKVHPETKDAPIFALVLAKGGSKLQPFDPARPLPRATASFGPGRLNAAAMPVNNLANFLANLVHRPVEDRTGLTGKYNVSLRWAPMEGEPFFHPGLPDTGDPSLPTALEEQLGLKLEPTRGPVQTIVVDHIEPPTQN